MTVPLRVSHVMCSPQICCHYCAVIRKSYHWLATLISQTSIPAESGAQELHVHTPPPAIEEPDVS